MGLLSRSQTQTPQGLLNRNQKETRPNLSFGIFPSTTTAQSTVAIRPKKKLLLSEPVTPPAPLPSPTISQIIARKEVIQQKPTTLTGKIISKIPQPIRNTGTAIKEAIVGSEGVDITGETRTRGGLLTRGDQETEWLKPGLKLKTAKYNEAINTLSQVTDPKRAVDIATVITDYDRQGFPTIEEIRGDSKKERLAKLNLNEVEKKTATNIRVMNYIDDVLSATDFIPVAGPIKKVGSEVAKEIAKESSKDAIKIILKKELPTVSDEALDVFSEGLRYIDQAEDVQTVLNRIDTQISEKARLAREGGMAKEKPVGLLNRSKQQPTQITDNVDEVIAQGKQNKLEQAKQASGSESLDPLTLEAKKYKSAEEFVKEKHPKVEWSIYEKEGDITLSKIVVPKDSRGEGAGTKAMEDLIQYADTKGKRILLTPSKDFGGSSTSRLTDFYKRFGFTENKGGKRDFSTRELMIREPHPNLYNQTTKEPSLDPEVATSLRKAKGLSADDIVKKHPDINLKKDVQATDIYGNKKIIPEGEALTPYELKGNKVLLQDGQTYIVSKNQWQNIKGNAVSGEAKDFAPELKETEETIMGQKDVVQALQLGDDGAYDSLPSNVKKIIDKYGEADGDYTQLEKLTKELAQVGYKADYGLDGEITTLYKTSEGKPTRYANYQLPGGENYKEVLIKAPESFKQGEYGTEVIDTSKRFRSSHWDEPNVISHLRLNERTYNGKKVTFMEELQSDWAREARKKGTSDQVKINWVESKNGDLNATYQGKDLTITPEGSKFYVYEKGGILGRTADTVEQAKLYAQNHVGFGVPNNSLLKNWQELSIKRALQEAVKDDSDYFAWINGEQTSARYNLATHLDNAKWNEKNGVKKIELKPKTGSEIVFAIDQKGEVLTSSQTSWIGKKLDEVLGKGLADKIMEKESGTLSGEGLKFGGEWANTLYDKQVANIVKDLTGAKIETLDMGLPINSKENLTFYNVKDGMVDTKNPLKNSDIKIGKDIWVSGVGHIITDVLGDGKFKAVPKSVWDGAQNPKGINSVGNVMIERAKESFDISVKKSPGQQAIKLTPEIKAKIRSEAPILKKASGRLPIIEESQKLSPKIESESLPNDTTKKGILQKIKETYESIPNKQGGFAKVPFMDEPPKKKPVGEVKPEQNIPKEERLKSIEIPGVVRADRLPRPEFKSKVKNPNSNILPWRVNYSIKDTEFHRNFASEDSANRFIETKLSGLDDTPTPEKAVVPEKVSEPVEGEVIRADFKETNKALAEIDKLERKAKSSVKSMKVVETERTLDDLKVLLEIAEDSLNNHPAKSLIKYTNKRTGELPEVLGGKVTAMGRKIGKFGQKGDDIVTESGFSESEDAREAVEAYQVEQQKLKDLKERIRDVRLELNEIKENERNERILSNFLNKESKKTEKDLIKRDKAEKQKKIDDATQSRLAKEEEYRRLYQKKLIEARRNTGKKEGLYQKIKEALFPLRSLDEKTQNIYRDWNRKRLIAKELANEEIAKHIGNSRQGLNEIIAYQAGAPIRYLRETFDSFFTEGRRRGLEYNYRDNYLPQVYDNTNEEISDAMTKYLIDKGLDKDLVEQYLKGAEELPEEISNRLKLNPTFTKQRVFPNYMTAIEYGLKPRYEKPIQLIAYYREEMEKTLANREFLERLLEEGKVLPVELTPDHWKALSLPFSPKGYYAEPKLAKILNDQFRDEENLGTFELSVKRFAQLSRKLQEIALSAGLPKTTVNFFAIGQLIKQMTLGDYKAPISFLRANSDVLTQKFFQQNKKYTDMMAAEGMDLGARIGSYDKLYQNLTAKWGEFGKKVINKPLTKRSYSGFKDLVGDTFDNLFNEKTFGSFMPQLYTQTFKDVYEQSIKKGLSIYEARQLAADITRKSFGLVEETGRGKTTEDTLSSLFFAPKFREGIINVLGNTGKAGYDFIRHLGGIAGKVNPSLRNNRRLLAGMIITYALYNALNYKLNGEYMWENESGKEFALKIPLPDGQNYVYIEFMPSFLAFARNMASGAIALGKGDLETATQKFGTIFSMPIKIGSEILTNSDYFGRPIYKDNDSGTQKASKIAQYVGLQPAHPYIKELIKYLQDKTTWWQSLSIALELPLKFSNKDKINTNKFYDAMEEQTKVRDKEKKELRPLYDQVQKLVAEGNETEAKKLVKGLSDEEYEIYKKIRASERAKSTKAAEAEMYSFVEEIQELKEIDLAEAKRRVKALSDEEYRIYQLAKKNLGY